MDDDLKRLKYELAQALRGLSERQTQKAPKEQPYKWTIQQIIEHLILSYQTTTEMLRARLVKGSPTRTKVTQKQLFAQFFVLNLGYFPKNREAPASVIPPQSQDPLSGDELRTKAFAALAEMDTILDASHRLFGRKRFESHFALGPLSVAQWYRFHFIHSRHHTRQIQAIRRQHRC